MHFVTTDRARIGRFTVPGTPWLIERVAAVWDLVLVTPPALSGQRTNKQHYSLLRILRLLKRSDGRSACIAMMPEGDEGDTLGLIDALPGSGRALYALSIRRLPIVPAAVWEEDGRLHASFGAAFSLAMPPSDVTAQALDEWVRNRVMRAIATLMPARLQGKHRSEKHGALE